MSRLLSESLQVLQRRLLLRAAHRHGMPIKEGNAVGLLSGGDAILDAALKLIRGARRDIRFEMYIWSTDSVGWEVLEALLEARKRGVAVRGMVDGMGSWGAGGMMAEANKAGADLRWFHAVAPWRPKVWNRRNHRKLLIADGSEAVVGSANWGLDYRPSENAHAFLDVGIVLSGPSVDDLVEDFSSAWRRLEGHPAPAPEFTESGRLWQGTWRENATVQVVSSATKGGHLAMRRHFKLLLSQVQEELLVANAYFLPTRLVLQKIQHLARRGRRVVLLLPGASDQRFVQAASRHVYLPLLSAGVRIFERDQTMLHAKAAVLDKETLFTGSANLDPRSFRHNLELNLLVRQPELVAEARALFEAQLPFSHEVKGREWSHRFWIPRFWSWFAYQFRWWL